MSGLYSELLTEIEEMSNRREAQFGEREHRSFSSLVCFLNEELDQKELSEIIAKSYK